MADAAVARPMTPEELAALGQQLLSPAALPELGVLLGCLGGAWGLSALLRRAAPGSHGAVLFGERIVDGALFPLLALGLALIARRVLLPDVPPGLFRLAVALLFSLAVIRLGVRVLRFAFPNSDFVRVAERSLSWAVWLGVILWITGVLPMLLDEMDQMRWSLGNAKISLRELLEGAFNAVVVLMLALWISAAIETRLIHGRSDNLSVRKMAANATRALLLFVGLLVALSAAGIDLTAFSVLGGAVGVGIGFGLQKLASNYISGFVILAERSLRIGDLVKVDNFEGRIADINTRSTIIRAPNGRESIVPNELLITQRVENASRAEVSVQASTVLQVAYGTDVLALRPKLLAALAAIPRVMKDTAHASAVHLSNFGPDGLELTVWYWNHDPDNGQANLRSEVNLAILQVLDAEGIEIPIPRRELHRGPAAAVKAPPPA